MSVTKEAHWTEYAIDDRPRIKLQIQITPRLWYWIEQMRGDVSKSEFAREILTRTMEEIQRSTNS